MTEHTCAATGETSTGKHYVLKTTEGEELVSPTALFGPLALVRDLVKKVAAVIERIERLEQLLQAAGLGDGQEQDPVRQAAQEAAAPVKKAPRQRKAAD